ncbi:MAG: translocation/assembly module TamB domain-containing protein [Caulobacteraceae bacterium]
MNVRATRIDGSLYGRMHIQGLELRDPRGVFAEVPDLTLDWRPLAYVGGKVDIRELSAPTIRVLRRPELNQTKPRDPHAPLLPDIDVSVRKLHIGQLILEAPVTGRRHITGLDAAADLADGRVQLTANAAARIAPGVAGGDRLTLRVDAVPKDNRLLVDARLSAPAGGLVDSYAKLGKPLALSLGGKGDWANWSGTAAARLGNAPIADLAVTAHSGTFRIAGEARPALILAGPAAQLTQPAVRIDGTATLGDRRADTRVTAQSDAFSLAVDGLIDLGRNRFSSLKLDARLLKPGAIAANLSGRDVALALTLDGPFANPTIAYRASAARIAFGETVLQGLDASGKATVNAEHILIPIAATARRVTGIKAIQGGLLDNLKLNGSLAVSGGRIMSDNLRLRSNGLNATAIIVADPAKGVYTGALKGRINGYEFPGVGRFDLVTDARLFSGRTGGFGIRGSVRAASRRLDNATLRDLLGGAGILNADIAMDEKGVITLGRLTLASPKFRIAGATARYQPNGRIALNLKGDSTAYGPFTVVASGTAQRPNVRLVAAKPGLGADLRDLQIELVGTGAGYQVQARAGSAYGPLEADLLVHGVGKPPLAVDIRKATFAGVTARGTVTQSIAGPFVGGLDIDGSGLKGTVRLAAQGKVQRADADIGISNANFPSRPPVTVGAGVVKAAIVLFPGAPSITADARVVNLRQGATSIAAAQARVRYQNGDGQVALTAKGRSGAPFEIAAQAELTSTRIRANVKGLVNGIALRLAAPAEILKTADGWRLPGTTVVLPKGEVQLNGQTGVRTELHASLHNVDLSILRPVAPNFAVEGQASGMLDVSLPPGKGAVPTVQARMDIARLTRTGIATAPAPVDVAMSANLSAANGAETRAVIRRGGNIVGRLDAKLAPIGPGSTPWMGRLMAAPLSGGVRYNGPSELLWALSGVTGQELSGPIAIAADFGGRMQRPALTGVVRTNALRYENQAYGTVISNITLQARFDSSRLQIENMTGRAGSGSLTARGFVGLDAESGFPLDIQVSLDRAQLARSSALDATVSGTLAVLNNKTDGALIRGDLLIPQARYQIIREASADVPDLTGVRRKGAPPPSAEPPKTSGPPTAWRLDVRVRADNRIFVGGMGLEAEWRTDLRVSGMANAPVVLGDIRLVRGTYSFAGRQFDLSRGIITFDGLQTSNPQLDIVADTTLEGITASINIGGRAQTPQISFTSTPALAQDEVLARLLFGESVGNLSATQGIQLAAALNSLRGGGGGLNPLGKLRSATGVDRLRVLSSDQAAGRSTSLAAGKYITNNIYIEIITDARGFTATQLEIALSKSLSFLSQTGSFGGSHFSVRYGRNW